MEKVILHREEKAVSFDESDNTIHFHKTYYTIEELEETINNEKFYLSAWTNISKNGKKYISLKASAEQKKESTSQSDDIPF